MKTVRQILAHRPPRLLATSPDATVFDALSTMAEHDVGALLVLDGARLAGIFSERDYARKIILLGKSSKETKVREIMTEKVLYVRPHHTVDHCMALMNEKHIRHLPVLEDDEVFGVISMRDVVKEVVTEQRMVIDELESYIRAP